MQTSVYETRRGRTNRHLVLWLLFGLCAWPLVGGSATTNPSPHLVPSLSGDSNRAGQFSTDLGQAPRSAATNLFVSNSGRPLTRDGCPLTNSLTASWQGRTVLLDYQLAGADGQYYHFVDRSHPPRFTIYKNGRLLHTGKFEFG